jgi:hypothetical protein
VSPAFSLRPRLSPLGDRTSLSETRASAGGASAATGPASYDVSASVNFAKSALSTKPNSRSCSMGGKLYDPRSLLDETGKLSRFSKRNPSPGPGSYVLGSTLGQGSQLYKSAAAAGIRGRSGSAIGSNRSARYTPGPGAYGTGDSPMLSTVHTSPRATFGHGEARPRTAMVTGTTGTLAGPANYELPSGFSAFFSNVSAGATVKGRTGVSVASQAEKYAHFPGPGAYDEPDMDAISRGRGRVSSKIGGHFSTGERNSSGITKAVAALPGPGQYENVAAGLSSVRTASPSFSLRSRYEPQNSMVSLSGIGPGAYAPRDFALGDQTVSTRRTQPAFSMTGRTKPVTTLVTPGPGAYGELEFPLLKPSLRAAFENITQKLNLGGTLSTLSPPGSRPASPNRTSPSPSPTGRASSSRGHRGSFFAIPSISPVRMDSGGATSPGAYTVAQESP